MYDYSLPDGLPSGSRTVWSNLPLQPLVRGPMTPFSYSVVAEIAGRAWYQYFDRLGFNPTPRARVVRQYQGRPYLNLTLSAQRDVEGAAIEPLTFVIDGAPFPICKWEKPGLVASLKSALAQNKVEATLKSITGELATIGEQAQVWSAKTAEMRWTQAEVLQIMEEIENVGVPSFQAFLAARHQLDLAYNRLIRLTVDRTGFPANLALIAAALDGEPNLTETMIANEMVRLGQRLAEDERTLAWLRAEAYEDWERELPDPTLITAIQNLLTVYGHRCVDEGEIRQPRWLQQPASLFALILAAAEGRMQPVTVAFADPAALLDQVEAGRRKEAQQLLQKVYQLRPMQSQALHAFAYVLAGARRWALAAARDAQVDQRLLAADDAFFFELEELKEMMTGEWNISSRNEIQATNQERRQKFAEWQVATPAELLVGDNEACSKAGEIPAALVDGLGVHFEHGSTEQKRVRG